MTTSVQMEDRGFEHPTNSLGNRGGSEKSGTQCGTLLNKTVQVLHALDIHSLEEVQTLINFWPTLPAEVRNAVQNVVLTWLAEQLPTPLDLPEG